MLPIKFGAKRNIFSAIFVVFLFPEKNLENLRNSIDTSKVHINFF
jgi:hypothetical protein